MDFFLDTSPITTPETLLEHLLAAFASGKDEAVINLNFMEENNSPKRVKMTSQKLYNSSQEKS